MNHATIIDALGGNLAVTVALGVGDPSTVAHWRRRGIPAARWPDIAELANRSGLEGVTERSLKACRPRAAASPDQGRLVS